VFFAALNFFAHRFCFVFASFLLRFAAFPIVVLSDFFSQVAEIEVHCVLLCGVKLRQSRWKNEMLLSVDHNIKIEIEAGNVHLFQKKKDQEIMRPCTVN